MHCLSQNYPPVFAFDAYCKVLKIEGLAFIHSAFYRIEDQKTLSVSYHPSRQNMSTEKLTLDM
jgi:hypothetical protein